MTGLGGTSLAWAGALAALVTILADAADHDLEHICLPASVGLSNTIIQNK
jgi:hypothetical protein